MKSKALSVALIVTTVIVATARIMESSDRIITHWNLADEATSYGSKYLIWILPAISAALFALLTHHGEKQRKAAEKQAGGKGGCQTDYFGIITPLIMLLMLYVTACSAQFVPMYSAVTAAMLAMIFAAYMYTHRKARTSRAA